MLENISNILNHFLCKWNLTMPILPYKYHIQRSYMEVTFMPRRKVHSVNFLERFKGKLRKVDRYGGIQGVLDGHSRIYDSIEVEAIKKDHTNSQSRTIEKNPTSKTSSRVKSRVHQSLSVHDSNDPLYSRLKETKLPVPSNQCRTYNYQDNNENVDNSNLNESLLFLPRIHKKQIAYSKCSNRIKTRNLMQRQAKESQITTIRSRVLYRHNVLETLEHNN